MVFHILSLFPEAFESYFGSSIIKRAQDAGVFSLRLYTIRDYTDNKWRKADDRPYGGGPGMVMYAEPIIRAVESITQSLKPKTFKIVILSPGGKQFTNTTAKTYAHKYEHVILICGHYEGIDARVKKALKAEDVSVGPYVLSGGELPAMTMVDAISRQIAGVLGDSESVEENRVSSSEVYTRPEVFEYSGKKYKVPAVLLSGHHLKIQEWKAKKDTKPKLDK